MATGVRTRRASQKAAEAAPMHSGATNGDVDEQQPLMPPRQQQQRPRQQQEDSQAAARPAVIPISRAPRQPRQALAVDQAAGALAAPSFFVELWHAEHHELVLASDTAFWALLMLPLMFWWACVVWGIALHEGPISGAKVQHVLLWYDRGLLRPFGPLLPFGVILARAGLLAALHWWERRQGARTSTARPKQRLRLATLAKMCLQMYGVITLVRLALYLVHMVLQVVVPYHLVSDHIFLAATMLVCLHAEMLCVVSDLTRLVLADDSSPPSLKELGLCAVFVAALFLYILTSVDMFFTAKYYHEPIESALTVALVFFLFQLPALRWLVARRCTQEVVVEHVMVLET